MPSGWQGPVGAMLVAATALLGSGCAPRVEQSAPATPVAVARVLDLKGLRPAAGYVVALGYRAAGDGGGGVFFWDEAGGAEQDSGLGVLPAGADPSRKGRWRRLLDGSRDLQLLWFGAFCDGKTHDDDAFRAALQAAASGGAIVLPAARTCVIGQLNLGQHGSVTGQSAEHAMSSITIRGAVQTPAFWPGGPGAGAGRASTIYIDPPEPSEATCRPLANNTTATIGNGGITLGPNVGFADIENVLVWAGPNLKNCIINMSRSARSTPGGDPIHLRLSGVTFVGNGFTTAAGIFLSNTGYITIDECSFAGARNDILEDSGGYVYNTRITHSMFYPMNSGTCTDPEILLSDAEGVEISDNAFEYGLGGVAIGGLRGGTIRANWFNAEGVDTHGARAAWMRVVCFGCVVEGNRIIGGGSRGGSGVDGLRIQGEGALVVGNNFQGAFMGIPMTVEGKNVTVMNNFFDGSSVEQTDIVVSGTGHALIGNVHKGSNAHSVRLDPGSRGLIVQNADADRTTGKIDDRSSGQADGPSGWVKSPDVSPRTNPLDHADRPPTSPSNAGKHAR